QVACVQPEECSSDQRIRRRWAEGGARCSSLKDLRSFSHLSSSSVQPRIVSIVPTQSSFGRDLHPCQDLERGPHDQPKHTGRSAICLSHLLSDRTRRRPLVRERKRDGGVPEQPSVRKWPLRRKYRHPERWPQSEYPDRSAVRSQQVSGLPIATGLRIEDLGPHAVPWPE